MRGILPCGPGGNLARDTVFVLDADSAVRAAVGRWLAPLPCVIEPCGHADELFASPRREYALCLLAETHPPGLVGRDLISELQRRGFVVPTILMAGDADIPMAVRLMRDGAIDLLEKPLVGRLLVTRVRELLA